MPAPQDPLPVSPEHPTSQPWRRRRLPSTPCGWRPSRSSTVSRQGWVGLGAWVGGVGSGASGWGSGGGPHTLRQIGRASRTADPVPGPLMYAPSKPPPPPHHHPAAPPAPPPAPAAPQVACRAWRRPASSSRWTWSRSSCSWAPRAARWVQAAPLGVGRGRLGWGGRDRWRFASRVRGSTAAVCCLRGSRKPCRSPPVLTPCLPPPSPPRPAALRGHRHCAPPGLWRALQGPERRPAAPGHLHHRPPGHLRHHLRRRQEFQRQQGVLRCAVLRCGPGSHGE